MNTCSGAQNVRCALSVGLCVCILRNAPWLRRRVHTCVRAPWESVSGRGGSAAVWAMRCGDAGGVVW